MLDLVSAVFSEYRDFDTPTYYDLPSGTSEDPNDLGFWSVPEEDISSPTSVSAIEFSNPSSAGARLILRVMLWAGKKAVVARALIDLGSDGDFIDSVFVVSNGLSLLRRKHPIRASGFDGAPSSSGLITHFWGGVMTMIGSGSQLFDSAINLNSTKLGGFDMILGASWLRRHEGWVGGAGPSLRLFRPDPVTGSSPGEGSSSSSTPSSGVVSSSLLDISPQTSLPPQFSRFADIFNAQGPSTLPPHRPKLAH